MNHEQVAITLAHSQTKDLNPVQANNKIFSLKSPAISLLSNEGFWSTLGIHHHIINKCSLGKAEICTSRSQYSEREHKRLNMTRLNVKTVICDSL